MSSLLNELAAFESVMRAMKRRREEEQEEEERPLKKAREDSEEANPAVSPAKRIVSLESLFSNGQQIKEEEVDSEYDRPIISEMDFRRDGSVEAEAMIDDMFQLLEGLEEEENEDNASEMPSCETNIEVRKAVNEEEMENDSSSSIPAENTVSLFQPYVEVKPEPVEEEISAETTGSTVNEETPRQAEKEIKREVTEELEEEGPSTTASFVGDKLVVSIEWLLSNSHCEEAETEEENEEEVEEEEAAHEAEADVETAIADPILEGSVVEDSEPEPASIPPIVVRRSSRVASREVEETDEQKRDCEFWSGKSSSSKCPRCDEKVGKSAAARKAHYKKFHYDVFFAVFPKMNDVERWISCRIGASGGEAAKDARVCLSCEDNELYRGRIALLKHIKQCHRVDFPKLKESYRLYSRTRRPEDLAVQRMLN